MKVDGHNRFGFFGDLFLNFGRINIPVIDVNISEDWGGTTMDNNVDGGTKS